MHVKISLEPRPQGLVRTYIFESDPDAPQLYCALLDLGDSQTWAIIAPPGFYDYADEAVLPFVCLAYQKGVMPSSTFLQFLDALHEGRHDLAQLIAVFVGWKE